MSRRPLHRPRPPCGLNRYFFLDDADRALIEPERREANRLGYAVQLCTARYLGTFLTDLSQVPEEAVVYLADFLTMFTALLRGFEAASGQTRRKHAVTGLLPTVFDGRHRPSRDLRPPDRRRTSVAPFRRTWFTPHAGSAVGVDQGR
ncbi:DUF4158 domain-containing protein [Nocardiopsis sinuspersici]|uniref:DUF4158 domain-containing protein n=1 Tax=Nocardiopsis sinuspersici TaxID=501010 RepID=UPI001C54775B|nr:DUF4158 domain-containing protein [Nocardiopsis sinuspersici]